MQTDIDTVLFDFFDVIFADPLRSWLEDRGYEKNEHHEKTARLLDEGTITYDEYVERLAKISGERPEDLHKHFKSNGLLNAPLVETIKLLKQKYRIGLLSNTCTEEIAPLLEQNELRPLFDVVVISSETGFAKPDPEIFKYALDKLSAVPEHTLFIDDSERNINSAKSLGLHTVRYVDHDQVRGDLEALGLINKTSEVSK